MITAAPASLRRPFPDSSARSAQPGVDKPRAAAAPPRATQQTATPAARRSNPAAAPAPLVVAVVDTPADVLRGQEVRAHVRGPSGALQQVDFDKALPDAAWPMPYAVRRKTVTENEVNAAFAAALAERTRLLKLLRTDPSAVPAAPTVALEDGSQRVAVLHMGYGLDDSAGAAFQAMNADIGRIEGFPVAVRMQPERARDFETELARSARDAPDPKAAAKRQRDNIVPVHVDTVVDIWSEDAAAVCATGVCVPPPLPEGFIPAVAIYRDRIRRFCPTAAAESAADENALQAVLKKHAPEANFGMLGAVADRSAQLSYVALALASEKPVRVGFCPIEDGNVIPFRGADGAPHALIGRDTFALSKAALAHELGEPVSDAFTLCALGKDRGIDPAHIHLVEQPAFHIDMRVRAVGSGAFLVNDPRLVRDRMLAWNADLLANKPMPPKQPNARSQAVYEMRLTQWTNASVEAPWVKKDIVAAARLEAKLADRTVADLAAAGLPVRRIAAVYPQRGRLPANMLNAEQGLGRDRARFYTALGADPQVEKAFLDDMEAAGIPIQRYYFLWAGYTSGTLGAGGGEDCRCKAETYAG